MIRKRGSLSSPAWALSRCHTTKIAITPASSQPTPPQKPALYDTADATANSRINARLPIYLPAVTHRALPEDDPAENIGTTKDRRLLELELNTWVRSLVTEMTDPGDELQASHPLRDASVVVEDIEG